MQISCGTDIIEIDRIKESIESLGDNFINKIYTQSEIDYCESKKKMKFQHYAARFAAKEAIFKAISKILEDKYSISWKDVEVLNDDNGRPFANFITKKYDKIADIDVSISHCKSFAIANVVLIIN